MQEERWWGMSKEAIKRFLIETSVENAEGSQTWYVDATSEAEALKQYEQGGCDLYASNVEVTSLGKPEISGETTLDDFGDFAEQPAPATELREQEPPTVAELVCVCGAEWEWRNRDWELVTTPPAQPQHEPVSDRENAIIRFALHQFMSNAYSNMNAAAQDKDSRHYTVGAVEKFAKDAKDAEALLSRLQFKAPQPAQRKPLTRKQLADAWIGTAHITHATERQIAYARAVEAAHGIKENT